MKYQQNSKREEKSKFITNQLTNMAHIPIRSYLYLLLGTTLFSCVPQELKPPFELKCENIPVPVGVDTDVYKRQPHDLAPETKWFDMAQASINAIREVEDVYKRQSQCSSRFHLRKIGLGWKNNECIQLPD